MRSAVKGIAECAAGFWPAGRALNWAASRNSVIFAFHRVLPPDVNCYDPEMATSPESFEKFVQWVSERFQVVSLEALAEQLDKKNRRSPQFAAITFDDGWRDNFTFALPILRRYQVPATIFLALRFLGSPRRFWQDRLWDSVRRIDSDPSRETALRGALARYSWGSPPAQGGLPFDHIRRLLLQRPSAEAEEFVDHLESLGLQAHSPSERVFLDWEEVRSMQGAGVSFGSHTLNHCLLTRAPVDVRRNEIVRSRQELQERLGTPVTAFSYPWGGWSPELRTEVVDAGYRLAATTIGGPVPRCADPWTLPRVAVSEPVLQGIRRSFSSEKLALYLSAQSLRRRHSPNLRQMMGTTAGLH
jgi:peptidoglycan/xylan/chitin deacetylase (PgdA/CDA1 family)